MPTSENTIKTARAAVIADDLTGATTTGALLAARGVENVVVVGNDASQVPDSADAILVSTDSRTIPPAEAQARVRKATQQLLDMGCTLFSKRTDTTMRGGIGFEIDAMLDVLGSEYMAVIVPAMPPSKRIVVSGFSLIDSVLLARTGVANDLLNPVTDSYLPRLLNGQLRQPLYSITMKTVSQSKEAVKQEMARAREAGYRSILCDAVSNEDVQLIAAAVTELGWKTLCVDPGPMTTEYVIAQGIAHHPRPAKAALRTEATTTDQGTVFVVAGSATDVTRTQLRKLSQMKDVAVIQIEAENLIDNKTEEEVRSVLRQAQAFFESTPPRVVILTLDTTIHGIDIDLLAAETQRNLVSGQASRNLATNLGYVARKLLEVYKDRVAGLYVTGGDTLVNTCRAIEATGLSLEGYVIPQSDQGRIVGGVLDQLPIVCKGGLTGTELTAIHIVNRLFDERYIHD